jgi:hypothetical protein
VQAAGQPPSGPAGLGPRVRSGPSTALPEPPVPPPSTPPVRTGASIAGAASLPPVPPAPPLPPTPPAPDAPSSGPLLFDELPAVARINTTAPTGHSRALPPGRPHGRRRHHELRAIEQGDVLIDVLLADVTRLDDGPAQLLIVRPQQAPVRKRSADCAMWSLPPMRGYQRGWRPVAGFRTGVRGIVVALRQPGRSCVVEKRKPPPRSRRPRHGCRG